MDSFTAALARLDPASRALLDLSLRRGMKAEEISELLGSDAGSVTRAREVALRQLAGELDIPDGKLDELRARLAELPTEAWTGAAGGERPKLSVVRDPAEEEPGDRRERSRLPLLLAILAVAAVVLVIVLASSGKNEKATSSPPPQTQAAASTPAPAAPKPATGAKPSKPAPAPKPTSKPKPQAKPKVTALAPIGAGSGATGTAELTQGGKRLVVNVSGLPPADYEVWLYNSVVDAVSLTKVQGSKLSLDLKLPANASNYRYVDISREPNDGNPNHSGESVLRVKFSKLSR